MASKLDRLAAMAREGAKSTVAEATGANGQPKVVLEHGSGGGGWNGSLDSQGGAYSPGQRCRAEPQAGPSAGRSLWAAAAAALRGASPPASTAGRRRGTLRLGARRRVGRPRQHRVCAGGVDPDPLMPRR